MIFRFCEKEYTKIAILRQHESRHMKIRFWCSYCQQVFTLLEDERNHHLLQHENYILAETNYIKLSDSTILTKYEKVFESGNWPISIFEGEDLQHISDLIKISVLTKPEAIIKISLKIWFVSNLSLEDKIPRSTWISIPHFMWSSAKLGLKRNIKEKGDYLMLAIDNFDNIEGSGYVYYATSQIGITIIKNSTFGCELNDSDNYYSDLHQLFNSTIIFNPTGKYFCFQKCIAMHYSTQNKRLLNGEKKLQSDFPRFVNKETCNMLECIEWDKINTQAKIIIWGLKKENNRFFIQKLYQSQDINTQSENNRIHLLAIFFENKSYDHFMLIKHIAKFLTISMGSGIYLKNPNACKKVHKYCTYCINFISKSPKLVQNHEKFCLENPENHIKSDTSLRKDDFVFKQNSLECSSDSKNNPPNWLGFLDFETLNQSINDSDISQVCSSHRLIGESYCQCPLTIRSEKIQSISYCLLIIDFHTQKKVFDHFYIQKSSNEQDPGEHLACTLKKLACIFLYINDINNPIVMSMQDKVKHKNTKYCELCNIKFVNIKCSSNLFKNVFHANIEQMKMVNYSMPYKYGYVPKTG